jgi:hypothetical protein
VISSYDWIRFVKVAARNELFLARRVDGRFNTHPKPVGVVIPSTGDDQTVFRRDPDPTQTLTPWEQPSDLVEVPEVEFVYEEIKGSDVPRDDVDHFFLNGKRYSSDQLKLSTQPSQIGTCNSGIGM